MEIQKAQLEELRANNGLLQIIADNIRNSGASYSPTALNNQNKGKESISTANFSTKNNYLNHMKLTSMSFAG